jgi:hypothetical protein
MRSLVVLREELANGASSLFSKIVEVSSIAKVIGKACPIFANGSPLVPAYCLVKLAWLNSCPRNSLVLQGLPHSLRRDGQFVEARPEGRGYSIGHGSGWRHDGRLADALRIMRPI